jgi:hypothetical protein
MIVTAHAIKIIWKCAMFPYAVAARLLQHRPRLALIRIASNWSAVDGLDAFPGIRYDCFTQTLLAQGFAI